VVGSLCAVPQERLVSLLFRRRHAEVLAGGGRFSGLHSLRELLYSYGFVGEWLDRRNTVNFQMRK